MAAFFYYSKKTEIVDFFHSFLLFVRPTKCGTSFPLKGTHVSYYYHLLVNRYDYLSTWMACYRASYVCFGYPGKSKTRNSFCGSHAVVPPLSTAKSSPLSAKWAETIPPPLKESQPLQFVFLQCGKPQARNKERLEMVKHNFFIFLLFFM